MDVRTLDKDDLEAAWEVSRDAFHAPSDGRDGFLRFTDPEELTGIFDRERLVGLAGSRPFGQWFGGRAVAMGGVYAVAVVPDRRGQGVAQRALAASLASARDRGQLISTLFPATTGLYRKLGWELAGAFVWRSARPDALHPIGNSDARVRPFVPTDRSAVERCYARFARELNGFLDRTEARWANRFERWSEYSLYVVEGEGDELDGYLVYQQLDGEWSELGGDFRIAVEDVVCLTEDAARALWGLLGSWSPQVSQILFRGPPEDPLLLLLPEQPFETLAEVRWMTRLLDARGAVAARGFPDGLDAEVHLEVTDSILPNNTGRFVLRVQAGEGRLEPGGSGSIAVDVGALSSLYTGWGRSAVLARVGRLRGGSPAERAALDASFAGPTPWMLDEF